jgi:hypothetical protein
MTEHEEKIRKFADLCQQQHTEYMERHYTPSLIDYSANNLQHRVTVKPGAKYTKVDYGGSGKFMVDAAGAIYGIKAYGVIHRGHFYGTLDTTSQWYWGSYHPIKKVAGGAL